jgi:hypothetical protein
VLSFEQVVDIVANGPGQGFCFTRGRWWKYDDGFWDREYAGEDLTRMLKTFIPALADEEDLRTKEHLLETYLSQRGLNKLKRALALRLESRPGLPGRPNQSPTDLGAVPAPPAAPGPAARSEPAPPVTLPNLEQEDPAGTPSPAGPGA